MLDMMLIAVWDFLSDPWRLEIVSWSMREVTSAALQLAALRAVPAAVSAINNTDSPRLTRRSQS